MMIERLQENQLIANTWYCAWNDGVDGAFFKYIGDGQVLMDSNCTTEPDYISDIPYADYYTVL